MSVDLRQCKPGDKLLTKNGTILEYVGDNITMSSSVYPHEIKYPDGTFGSRTDCGKTYRFASLPEDEDVVEILK